MSYISHRYYVDCLDKVKYYSTWDFQVYYCDEALVISYVDTL